MGKQRKSKPGKSDTVEVMPTPIQELAPVWVPDIIQTFTALRPQQLDFLLAYLKTGNAAEAYRKAYNPQAEPHLASICGSLTLATTANWPTSMLRHASHLRFRWYDFKALSTGIQSELRCSAAIPRSNAAHPYFVGAFPRQILAFYMACHLSLLPIGLAGEVSLTCDRGLNNQLGQFTTTGILEVLKRFECRKAEVLFLISQTYREMITATKVYWVKNMGGQWEKVGEVPDWQARDNAAKGLARPYGLNRPESSPNESPASRVVLVELPVKAPLNLCGGQGADSGRLINEGPALAN